VNDSKGLILKDQQDSPILAELIMEGVRKLMASPNWENAYISAKVVKEETLYSALLQYGFQTIEFRRIYSCKIHELESSEFADPENRILYSTLATIPSLDIASHQEQILAITKDSFAQNGHTRHFTDSFLFNRCPGIKYILEVMKLNFENIAPSNFLLAFDNDLSAVCGFSVVGRKPCLQGNIYTQLLSAVSREYRGRGIYRGLTHLLSQTFPPDAQLLNVTHVENHKIQRAYEGSGRKHLADTVVMRRIF
jgi:hypothetical protein